MESLTGFDIIFLAYDELNADINFASLATRFTNIKRSPKVKGIRQAHQACASLAKTDFFFIVDGDNEVNHNFNFTVPKKLFQENAVHVWRALNPVNSLIYGYGAIKLYPKYAVLNAKNHMDQSTSITDNYVVIPELASVTRFNTSGLHSWRAAFRECAKLSSNLIKNSNQSETKLRLKTWCADINDVPFAKECLDGAREGRLYGEKYGSHPNEMLRINDFDWLTERYRDYYRTING